MEVPAVRLHLRHLRELLEGLGVCEVHVLGPVQLPDLQLSFRQLHQPPVHSFLGPDHVVLELHLDHCRRGHFPYKFLITVLVVLIRDICSVILTDLSLQLCPCNVTAHAVRGDAKEIVGELVSGLFRS